MIVEMNFYCVSELLPGHTHYVLVRCVDQDMKEFYLMASHIMGDWVYLVDSYHENMNLKITHWANLPGDFIFKDRMNKFWKRSE